MLDCKDGTILKPVILNASKGERELDFYELVNGKPEWTRYFSSRITDAAIVRQLIDFTPIFKGFISLPEHPDGE